MTMLIPMAFMVFYIAAFGVYTFFVRKNAVMSKQVSVKYFRVYDVRDGSPPEYIVRVARHFDNLLQAPLFFLVTGMLCLFYGLNGWGTICLGWAFVLSRFVHTWVHMGSNNILKRASSYFVGWIIILTLWVMILVHHFKSTQIVS